MVRANSTAYNPPLKAPDQEVNFKLDSHLIADGNIDSHWRRYSEITLPSGASINASDLMNKDNGRKPFDVVTLDGLPIPIFNLPNGRRAILVWYENEVRDEELRLEYVTDLKVMAAVTRRIGTANQDDFEGSDYTSEDEGVVVYGSDQWAHLKSLIGP
jgi:hypothetical protein